ncbi:MAG: hypothetical protein HKN56_02200 [Gammaproteobacteria bacterium]|nr:hypothetical protein [Gammaproteobacteria bacterium]
MNNQTRGRLILLGIAAAFALPIATAMFFYFSDNGWRPGEYTQRGVLITPPRTLSDTALTDAQPAPQFREVWSLVVPAGRNCDDVCADALDKIRQTRRWLGPKITRMQTVFLPTDSAALTPELAARHPQLITPGDSARAEARPVIGDYTNGDIFLVDPFGNVMMLYPAGTDMGDIRKDLGHLLKLSTIG